MRWAVQASSWGHGGGSTVLDRHCVSSACVHHTSGRTATRLLGEMEGLSYGQSHVSHHTGGRQMEVQRTSHADVAAHLSALQARTEGATCCSCSAVGGERRSFCSICGTAQHPGVLQPHFPQAKADGGTQAYYRSVPIEQAHCVSPFQNGNSSIYPSELTAGGVVYAVRHQGRLSPLPVQRRFRKYLRFAVGGVVYEFKTHRSTSLCRLGFSHRSSNLC